jgi:hypothetical protein
MALQQKGLQYIQISMHSLLKIIYFLFNEQQNL